MNRAETARLLAAIAAFNNRTIGEADVEAWQSVLPDVTLTDAMEAVRQHYAENTEWLMPAHVRHLVRDIHREREALARSTGWAPGQAGVPKDQAMPEVSGPVAAGELTAPVRALLDSVRAMLPEGSREALMPRTVAWEREHRAFTRVRDGEPNPLYKPFGLVKACDWHKEGGYGFKWDCQRCQEASGRGPAASSYCGNCIGRCEGQHGPCLDAAGECTQDAGEKAPQGSPKPEMPSCTCDHNGMSGGHADGCPVAAR